MVSVNEIEVLAGRIAGEFRPQRIILFGSRAYGAPRSDSDVDLLVIMPFRGNAIHKAVEILAKVATRFSVDLLVRTPQEVRNRLAWNDFFLKEIIEKGRVLYESGDPRMGRKGRGRPRHRRAGTARPKVAQS